MDVKENQHSQHSKDDDDDRSDVNSVNNLDDSHGDTKYNQEEDPYNQEEDPYNQEDSYIMTVEVGKDHNMNSEDEYEKENQHKDRHHNHHHRHDHYTHTQHQSPFPDQFGSKTSQHPPRQKPPLIIPSTELNYKPHELDYMLQEYDKEIEEAQKKGSKFVDDDHTTFPTTITTTSPTAATTTSSPLTLEQTEHEKQKLMDVIDQSFQKFIDHVHDKAATLISNTPTLSLLSNLAPPTNVIHPNSSNTGIPKNTPTLPISPSRIMEWERKLREIQRDITSLVTLDQEYKNKINQDLWNQRALSPHDLPTSYYLAETLNLLLDEKQSIVNQDLMIVKKHQQGQINVLQGMVSSYHTFYSWILDQWNRNISDMNTAFETIQKRLYGAFQKQDVIHRDLQQLLQRYHYWLDSVHSQLPMEFTLSRTGRDDWKTYMAAQQPEECLRIMKNEIKALENVSSLAPDVEKWSQELSKYNVSTIRTMIDNRNKMKKRLEDAVETETRETFQKKWKEFYSRVYHMGVELHNEASRQYEKLDRDFNYEHRTVLNHYEKIQKEINSLQSRLILSSGTLSDWVEKRKKIGKKWAMDLYWQLAIEDLLQVYRIVNDFLII